MRVRFSPRAHYKNPRMSILLFLYDISYNYCMPHVSKQKISEETRRKLDEYILFFLEETGSKERLMIFRELFTKTERLMIGKRLALLLLANKKAPTHAISKTLGMSPSTVARFEDRLDRGMYKRTARWLMQDRIRNAIVRMFDRLLMIPFEHKPIARFLDEN